MDAKLLGKLTRTEGDFVSAMMTGDGELTAYDFAWASLLDEISQASALGDISNTTLAVADDIVARVSTLAECCLSLSSVPPPSFPLLNPKTAPLSTSFITEAHSWLLENIANPYPSSTVKASLAQRYNCTLSAINSWFVNARRRMGWTALCRDSFNNCRADALDAAYRAFIKEDPNRQLSAGVIHAFVTVKVAAEELYSSTFVKSALANELETAVKEISEQVSVSVSERKCNEPEGTTVSSKASEVLSQNNVPMAKNHYPSPDRSPFLSPVPALDCSLTDESEDDEDIESPTLAGRKRRSSSEWTPPMSESSSRPMKRFRISSQTNACLPSPLTSTDEFSENERTTSLPITQSFASSKRRKRHLPARLPRHPQDSMAGPPLHTAHPLPLTTMEAEHSLDDWFRVNFDTLFAVPPPVDFAEPDHSTQEIELFNNYIIPEDLQVAVAPPIQGDRISPCSDLTALDSLSKSLESDGFVSPPETMYLPTMALPPPPVPVTRDLPLLPDLSQTIDWTALEENPFEPTGDLTFPRFYVSSVLPEIDLSILQLPRVWNPPSLYPSLIAIGAEEKIAKEMDRAYVARALELRSYYEKNISNAFTALPGFSFHHDSGKRVLHTFTSLYLKKVESWIDDGVTVYKSSRKQVACNAGVSRSSNPRRAFNTDYIPLLEHFFDGNPFPTHADKAFLAKKSGMTYRQIHVWFQNRRNRTKKASAWKTDPIRDNKTRSLDCLRERMAKYTNADGRHSPLPRELSRSSRSSVRESMQKNSSKTASYRVTPSAEDTHILDGFTAPLHAFPSPYPPVCAYKPFPLESRGQMFTSFQWARSPNHNKPPQSPMANVNDLADRFALLSVRDIHAKRLQKGSEGMRNSFAATYFITTTAPPAPHPALINPVNVVPSLASWAPFPIVRTSESTSRAFMASNISTPSSPHPECVIGSQRKASPKPKRCPPLPCRIVAPATLDASSTSPCTSPRSLSDSSQFRKEQSSLMSCPSRLLSPQPRTSLDASETSSSP